MKTKIIFFCIISSILSLSMYAESVFIATCEKGMIGKRTTYINNEFEVEDDRISTIINFRIDSSDPTTLIVEQNISESIISSYIYMVVNSTSEYIQAVGLFEGAVQVYTILINDGVVTLTNQRAFYVDNLGKLWPPLVSSMWGWITIKKV